VLIECSRCEAVVHAKEIAEHEINDPFDTYPYFKVSLLECPRCKDTLVSGQRSEDLEKEGYSDPVRLWPEPYYYLPQSLPKVIRESIYEAEKCFKAKAYTATAVMCGRALEGICRHFETESKYIGKGLTELKEREIIDNRLFEWSVELQKSRNIGAHANDDVIEKRDADDLIAFVKSIVEYVFVMTARFEQFKSRKIKANK